MAKTKKTKADGAEYPKLTNEEFVKAYIACKNTGEAAEKIGPSYSARAKRMRDAGVKLPKLPGSRVALAGDKVAVAALNALIPASK
jgi:hypothetical protein